MMTSARYLQSLLMVLFLSFSGSARAQMLNLFNGGHEDAPLSVSIGYVNKDWVTTFEDGDYHENLWGEEGRHLHGVQLGIGYAPCIPAGLGIHTGLYYEAYLSFSGKMRRDYDYDQYTEHSIYLPLHAMFRIPLGQKSSLSIYAGLGINWAMFGEFKENKYLYDHWTGDRIDIGDYEYNFDYGYDGWPKSLNASLEAGATLRINHVNIGFTISDGLTDHGFYHHEGNYKTKQQKLAISVGLAI